MEIEFDSDDLSELAKSAAFDGGFPRGLVKTYRKRVQFIESAKDERDFYAFKSLHFEKLKGNRSGKFSMRLNKQWRLILRFDSKGAKKKVVLLGIEDYH